VTDIQKSKELVRNLYDALAVAGSGEYESILGQHMAADHRWRGVHPFDEQRGAEKVAQVFWEPLHAAFSSLQRREDIFMAGVNASDADGATWVISMGKLLGLFDEDWLGILATGRMVFLPYVDFHRVAAGEIVETVGFCDVLSVMQQSGLHPLPQQTGATVLFPGPRTQDGLMVSARDPQQGERTLALLNKMIADLLGDLVGASMSPSRAVLASTWCDDMCWFGPVGIGATFTIDRYRQQHQGPFSAGLTDFGYKDHECLAAEGHFGALFAWTGFTMRSTGGFMGLPASDILSTMRVADVYRRDGDKLAENWVFIDVLHFLYQQGLDVLERCREINHHSTDGQV